VKKVHLVGIGGVGMAGLAVLLKARGCDVSGCDIHRSPRTDWLESQGIRVFVGHDPAHVAAADEVIVTPAVRADNPERVAAAGRIRCRGDVLADLVSQHPDSIAVCGSHGKTTTSTWIAKLLLALGENVSWAIGGESGEFPVGHAGGSPLIVEADESDGTLARYHATTLVVTNCDYDHPDHFKTREDYLACFDAAKANAKDVVDVPSALEPLAAPLRLDALGLAPHNRRNALMAAEVARRRGHSLDAIADALPAIVATLPDRRFQPLAPGVYTDYAHHPTEMACAVSMARAVCRGTLRVLFQPHRYSRTKALLNDFPKAFAGADEVVLCPTYAAFEEPVEGGDVADLYAACRESLRPGERSPGEQRLFLARSCDEAWEHARNSMRDGDVTLLLGAGDIVSLVPQVQAGAAFPRRRVWIGAGTNTWKSDLNLSIDYVKTSGPAGATGASLVAAHPTLIPWMAGIPGTVGGWIKMNAGAFGHSISEVLDAVKIDGEWIAAKDCCFAYRTSAIQGEIQDFRLKANVEDLSSREGDESEAPESYLSKRLRFPPGTFGSFFKNPPGDYAGRLLEAVGAKGLRVGGACVWEGHANVIVRGEGATPSDVLALAQILVRRVQLRLGVSLEPEVCGLASGSLTGEK
jgi:UDP-N-acetylmuramate--alanine ligase